MGEESNNNLLSEILGALVTKGSNGESTFGGNWMWVIFLFFMMSWGGGGFNGFGFGNRGGFFPPPATQADVMATTGWGQTQDALREIAQSSSAQNAATNQALSQLGYNSLAQSNATNQAISQLGYNSLAQSNETNQQLAQQGFNLQTAIMAGNNLLQGAIMGGNNLINNSIQQMSGDTRLAICQNGNATQNAIFQTSAATQAAIADGKYATQNAIFQTGAATQAAIAQMNGDNKLAICQANNNTQATVNANSNAIQAAIRETSNNAIQGITSLGFLTQQKTDELKYELAKSTCAITSNDTANTQKVLDKLCMMEANQQAQRIQELQVANQALMLSNQVKDLQAGQVTSAGYIVNALRPYPVPAYTVSSPYGTTTTPTTGG